MSTPADHDSLKARRDALLQALAGRLNADRSDQQGFGQPCDCGRMARYAGRRPKTFTTALGDIELERAWYHCQLCRTGFSPRDRALGLEGTSPSSAALRMAGLTAARVSFAETGELLRELAGPASASTTSPATVNESDIPPSAPWAFASPPAWSRPPARTSLAHASNAAACTGPSKEPMPSSLCVAPSSPTVSMTSGNAVLAPNKPHPHKSDVHPGGSRTAPRASPQGPMGGVQVNSPNLLIL